MGQANDGLPFQVRDKGTHIRIGVNAARDDVKLLIKRIKRCPFIPFVVRLAGWLLSIMVRLWKLIQLEKRV